MVIPSLVIASKDLISVASQPSKFCIILASDFHVEGISYHKQQNKQNLDIRGLSGKFVDILAIRKSKALLKKCFV